MSFCLESPESEYCLWLGGGAKAEVGFISVRCRFMGRLLGAVECRTINGSLFVLISHSPQRVPWYLVRIYLDAF